MIAAKQMDVRVNIKKYFDMAFYGEPVIVSREENKMLLLYLRQNITNWRRLKRMLSILQN